jgi:RIO kinase 1
MSKNRVNELIDELDDLDEEVKAPSKKQTIRKRESKRHETDVRLFVRAQEHSQKFQFTYKAARFEEAWLLDSLMELAQHEWITDVLRKVKAGKEASVYVCKSGPGVDAPLVAAKIYRPRSLRNLKNDGIYRTGRIDLGEDGKTLYREADVNAIIKRTKYGEELRHQSWIAYEYQTLELLHNAGANVPKPYVMERNAILMGFVGDLESAAPSLNSVALDQDEARHLFDRVIRNVDLLLANGRIHGDLSAYNILYWDGDITLIDFPQVVPPDGNPSAWNIFLRDVTRVCQYFHTQGVHMNGHKLASELWTSHGHRIVKETDPRYLDAEDNNDRRLWEKQRSGR